MSTVPKKEEKIKCVRSLIDEEKFYLIIFYSIATRGLFL